MRNDIEERGIRHPLEVRLIDGVIQLVDGERRLRCVKTLGFKDVPCHVHEEMSDEEAWATAWRANDTAKEIGDNASASLVKHWKEKGYSDQKILDITNRSTQWLHQMYVLGKLDSFCFDAYTSGRVGLRVALDLAKIEDEEVRVKVCELGIKEAEITWKEQQSKIDKSVLNAENKFEIAEARLVAAESIGTLEDEVEAGLEVEKTKENLDKANEEKTKHSETKPQMKKKHLLKASKKAGGKVNSFLGKKKIERCLTDIEGLIETDESEVAYPEHLRLAKTLIKSFLEGENDVTKIFEGYYAQEEECEV
jgi:ParB-like chromosome segregation protein Spo0J